jgi:hypothetical protein
MQQHALRPLGRHPAVFETPPLEVGTHRSCRALTTGTGPGVPASVLTRAWVESSNVGSRSPLGRGEASPSEWPRALLRARVADLLLRLLTSAICTGLPRPTKRVQARVPREPITTSRRGLVTWLSGTVRRSNAHHAIRCRTALRRSHSRSGGRHASPHWRLSAAQG